MDLKQEGYDDLLRQRRNLMATSVIIILYLAAAGEIEHIAGVKIREEQDWVAEFVLWLGLLYFWWRYRIYQPPMFHIHFQREIISHRNEDKVWLKQAEKYYLLDGHPKNAPRTPGDVGAYRLTKREFGWAIECHHKDNLVTAVVLNPWIGWFFVIRGAIVAARDGKVFTGLYVPNWLGFLTVLAGLWVHYRLDWAAYFFASVLIVYIWRPIRRFVQKN